MESNESDPRPLQRSGKSPLSRSAYQDLDSDGSEQEPESCTPDLADYFSEIDAERERQGLPPLTDDDKVVDFSPLGRFLWLNKSLR